MSTKDIWTKCYPKILSTTRIIINNITVMAAPRVFLSSTCYDLKELRSQIREFIIDSGYEAVLSEYGDIFFEYNTHPQDSCFSEVKKCQMFVLVIGNTYGSHYYNQDLARPTSVTMKEFETALKEDIPKHIFINRFVEYDYQNYNRAWTKKLRQLNSDGLLGKDQVDGEKYRDEFDSSYHFAHESYRHLFRFIEAVYKNNLSVCTFELADEIKQNLTKQWAGAMYEYLTKDKSIPNTSLYELSSKIERLNDMILKLVDNKQTENGTEITFDVKSLIGDQKFSTIEQIKNKVFGALQDILPYGQSRRSLRKHPNVSFSPDDINRWVSELEKNLDVFKWRSYLNQQEVLLSLGAKIATYYPRSVNPNSIANICIAINTCKSSFATEEYKSLIKAIADELNTMPTYIEDDSLPF